MTLSNAHKKHVHHLCTCLKASFQIQDGQKRQIFLQENYQPLIYLPKLTNSQKELFLMYKEKLNHLLTKSLQFSLITYLNEYER